MSFTLKEEEIKLLKWIEEREGNSVADFAEGAPAHLTAALFGMLADNNVADGEKRKIRGFLTWLYRIAIPDIEPAQPAQPAPAPAQAAQAAQAQPAPAQAALVAPPAPAAPPAPPSLANKNSALDLLERDANSEADLNDILEEIVSEYVEGYIENDNEHFVEFLEDLLKLEHLSDTEKGFLEKLRDYQRHKHAAGVPAAGDPAAGDPVVPGDIYKLLREPPSVGKDADFVGNRVIIDGFVNEFFLPIFKKTFSGEVISKALAGGSLKKGSALLPENIRDDVRGVRVTSKGMNGPKEIVGSLFERLDFFSKGLSPDEQALFKRQFLENQGFRDFLVAPKNDVGGYEARLAALLRSAFAVSMPDRTIDAMVIEFMYLKDVGMTSDSLKSFSEMTSAIIDGGRHEAFEKGREAERSNGRTAMGMAEILDLDTVARTSSGNKYGRRREHDEGSLSPEASVHRNIIGGFVEFAERVKFGVQGKILPEALGSNPLANNPKYMKFLKKYKDLEDAALKAHGYKSLSELSLVELRALNRSKKDLVHETNFTDIAHEQLGVEFKNRNGGMISHSVDPFATLQQMRIEDRAKENKTKSPQLPKSFIDARDAKNEAANELYRTQSAFSRKCDRAKARSDYLYLEIERIISECRGKASLDGNPELCKELANLCDHYRDNIPHDRMCNEKKRGAGLGWSSCFASDKDKAKKILDRAMHERLKYQQYDRIRVAANNGIYGEVESNAARDTLLIGGGIYEGARNESFRTILYDRHNERSDAIGGKGRTALNYSHALRHFNARQSELARESAKISLNDESSKRARIEAERYAHRDKRDSVGNFR
ncbi:MAG: hypothetical protein LBH46_03785 [Rickettsiales bacterium]|jgi:hypothetical protein|nr:hypothetical protein [Rickettsiales bacterium]